ncbi:MAG: sigma-54 dependent transcriptional regulator [Spirochaetales bacterium]|nr:sigma-54 dependent transcriptional regulator [Spirochaetales bacterium]
MRKILIIDDDVAVTNYLRVFLMQNELSDSTVVNDSREVSGLLSTETFDVILLDMDMPQVGGLDILEELRERKIDTPVVVLTGVNDVALAVKAVKLGAFDYLIKPVDDEYLLEVLNNAIAQGALHQTIDRLPGYLKREELIHKEAFVEFPTQDPRMIRLLHQAESIASSDLNLSIWGELGIGRLDLARAIHRISPRRKGPFVVVDASAHKPEDLVSLFFGQAQDWSGRREERQGFLEEASGGTLFLENIDAFPLPAQARLNKVIQTGEYYTESSTQIRRIDVRFITALLHDPAIYAKEANLSSDLFHHLTINSIHIPPLRERAEDIPLLVQYFLGKELKKTGDTITDLDPGFIERLKKHDFPENVQELRTIVAEAAGGNLFRDGFAHGLKDE